MVSTSEMALQDATVEASSVVTRVRKVAASLRCRLCGGPDASTQVVEYPDELILWQKVG